MKFVKLNLKDHTSAPKELLEKIRSNKIRNEIAENWGTKQCRMLLDELTADTRDNTRQGFPEDIAAALIELSVLHEMKMQDLGFDALTDSEFMINPTIWKLPKNF